MCIITKHFKLSKKTPSKKVIPPPPQESVIIEKRRICALCEVLQTYLRSIDRSGFVQYTDVRGKRYSRVKTGF